MLTLFVFGATNGWSQQQSLSLFQHALREKIRGQSSSVFSQKVPFLKNNTLDQKLSDSDTQEEGEPFIAVNPKDSNNVVVSYMNIDPATGILDFPIYYSQDGGGSWEKSNFIASSIYNADPIPNMILAGGGDPVLAFDREGKLYFSWIFLALNFSTLDGRFLTYWASSTDGGKSWEVSEGSNKLLADGGFNFGTGALLDEGNGVLDRQWLAVDQTGGAHDGVLYCSGLFFSNDSTEIGGIILRKKLPDSDVFEPNQVVVSDTPNAQFGNVHVDRLGRVHITYGDLDSFLVKHTVSEDGGTIFNQPTVIGNFNWLFEDTVRVNELENPAINFAIDPINDELHLVWNAFDDKVNGFYSRSLDGGKTWSEAQNIADLIKLPNHQIYFPNVVAQDGQVSISAYVLDTEDAGNYALLQSEDSGTNWEAPLSLSSQITNFKDYPLGTQFNPSPLFGDYFTSARSACKTFSAWSDGRNGEGPKIYIGVVDHCEMVSQISTLEAEEQDFYLKAAYPNPVEQTINLELELMQTQAVSVSIMDASGRVIQQLESGQWSKGTAERQYDLSNLAKGVYFLTVKSKQRIFTKSIEKL
ncbi:MAG: T9SS type A sorting domain-containing protein [Bacteroidota bacterium]